MGILYVLVMLSGAPGPTWTASTPVMKVECEAMQRAVEKASAATDGFMGRRAIPPALSECVQVEIGQ
jgi:hypothetical protein